MHFVQPLTGDNFKFGSKKGNSTQKSNLQKSCNQVNGDHSKTKWTKMKEWGP